MQTDCNRSGMGLQRMDSFEEKEKESCKTGCELPVAIL